MQKYFNIAGPCNEVDHYMVNASDRLQQLLPLIEQKQYFVIHAARQSGKTTLLLDMVNKLNASGKYYALYCSLESIQGIKEAEKGIPAIINTLKLAFLVSKIPFKEEFGINANLTDYSNVLIQELRTFCLKIEKPLILFFDEADCLTEQTLISFLRQLRNGYNSRTISPFVHSLALVGMRNIRDFKAKIRPDSDTLGSSSPFNIVTESLTLKNFSKTEIEFLYNQHSQQTGQKFSIEAIELVYEQTNGQPWLVNAIARECIVKILESDYTQTITEDHVKQAIQNIILRRDTHIDSLLERLKEERVQKIIEPIITGSVGNINKLSDDFLYTKDLGLIRDDGDKLEPANLIYSEVIIRSLSFNTQESIRTGENEYHMPRYLKNGIIDMKLLLTDFQEFWRENADIWLDKYDYKEAAPHLILMAFLQRVVNGGGQILRELAAERKRLDLCIVYNRMKYPIELKIYRSEKTIEEGYVQISRYMNSLGSKEGWLVIFDRDENKSWDEKLCWKTKIVDNYTINVVGC